MADAPFAVHLAVPSGPYPVGGPISITIAVTNISDHPQWIVGVLDGSEAGFRYPRYLPRISGPEPLPPPEGLPFCGNVAPLRLQDFLSLKPGESFDPTVPNEGAAYLPLGMFAGFRPPVPGTYEFRLTLETESREDEEWLGISRYPGWEEVLARLARVPRVRVESDAAVVEVI